MTEQSGGESIEAIDGLRLHLREWGRAENVEAAVLYVHGLASHAGWIGALARRMAEQGCFVFAPDLRGHGRTGPVPGDLPGPGLLLDDLGRCFERLRERVPRPPWFVMGTSLGGCLAASFSAHYRGNISGVILISPAFEPIYLSMRESLSIAADLLVGGRKQIPTPRARGLAICRSQEIRRQLGEDPLSPSSLPARAHLSALRILWRAKRDLKSLRRPVLCLQGAHDPVISSEWNRRHFQGRERTRFDLVAEGYHDLGLEPEIGQVDRRIGDWMAETLGRQGMTRT